MMKQIALLTILFSVFLSYVFPAEAQTNRPSVFPHGITVSNSLHAVTSVFQSASIATAVVQKLVVSNLQVLSTATVTNLSAERLGPYNQSEFLRVVYFHDSYTNPPERDGTILVNPGGVWIWISMYEQWVPLLTGVPEPFPWE